MKEIRPTSSEEDTASGILRSDTHPPTTADIDHREPNDVPDYVPPAETPQAPGMTVNDDALRPTPPEGNAQIAMIEALFDEFAACAENSNKTSTDESLFASVYRPRYSFKESSFNDYSSDKQLQLCKGHISTRVWGLLFQGYSDRVDIFLVQSENILRYMSGELNTGDSKALMVATATQRDEELVWRVDGEIVSVATLPRFARRIFGYLFLVASGEVSQPKGAKVSDTELIELVTAPTPSSVLLDEQLLTWDKCRALVQTLEVDLALMELTKAAGTETVKRKDAELTALQTDIELRANLNSLKEHISDVLSKYSFVH